MHSVIAMLIVKYHAKKLAVYVSVSAMPRSMHTYTQIKTLSDVLGLVWLKYVRCENGYFGGRGNIESIMLLWLPICRC